MAASVHSMAAAKAGAPGRSDAPQVSSRLVGARRPDWVSIGGLILAVAGIVGGMVMEGGQIREIMQHTAAAIVFGGTFGALCLTTPLRVLLNAAHKLGVVFFPVSHSPDAVIDEIIRLATKARKSGVVSLDQDAEQIPDRFLKKALRLVIDGCDVKEMKSMMELEIHLEGQHYDEAAKAFTAAGGYAPTIGIIGAVLGLMQVMKNLANIDEVGHGIATAFVATVYGVGAANVFLLPVGNKIKANFQAARQIRELMLKGVVGIAEGVNPKLVRIKLEAYAEHWSVKRAPKKTKQPLPVNTPAGAGAART